MWAFVHFFKYTTPRNPKQEHQEEGQKFHLSWRSFAKTLLFGKFARCIHPNICWEGPKQAGLISLSVFGERSQLLRTALDFPSVRIVFCLEQDERNCEFTPSNLYSNYICIKMTNLASRSASTAETQRYFQWISSKTHVLICKKWWHLGNPHLARWKCWWYIFWICQGRGLKFFGKQKRGIGSLQRNQFPHFLSDVLYLSFGNIFLFGLDTFGYYIYWYPVPLYSTASRRIFDQIVSTWLNHRGLVFGYYHNNISISKIIIQWQRVK